MRMVQLHIVFSHGKESGPWGTKISAMAEVARREGYRVTSIDYRGINEPQERVDKLLRYCDALDDSLVLVGSSMGGHVAAAAALHLDPVGVFVLAPAFYMPGYEDLTPTGPSCPMCIVHAWGDEVVPVDNSIRFARSCQANLILVDGDHRLSANIEQIESHFERFLSLVSEPDAA